MAVKMTSRLAAAILNMIETAERSTDPRIQREARILRDAYNAAKDNKPGNQVFDTPSSF